MARKATPSEEGSSRQDARYQGPWYRVTALARHTPNFRGRVDLGTYRESEKLAGRVALRQRELEQDGYEGIQVDFIPAEEEVYPESTPSKIGRKTA